MTKIIVLAPVGGTSNGADIAANHQIVHLRALGHDVTLVVRVPHTAEYARFLDDHGIASHVLDYGWWGDLAEDGQAMRDAAVVGALAVLLDRERFDVAITNTVHMPWLAIAAAGAGVPHLWLIHEFPSGQFASTRAAYPFVEAFSNEILAASPLLARELSEYVSHTPVNYFLPYTDAPGLAPGGGNGAPRLVSVNHVSEGKNTLELVKVYELVRRRFPELTLEIRGGVNEPAYADVVRTYIAERGLGGVTFASDPAANWAGVRQNDVVVHTSHLETFSLTLTETLKGALP
ncbi:glycosyltransferase [Xylanimonas protaetiae]|uniref:Glycosyltransferase n=1 Tax=Xylanimonas protaetiae TaxID=2509457 RepID=A0A4P6FE75_9MICO|nr:glycosyltransferase [Xylanimonas protaetiae]QAY68908.1 glycosyltransferase [Xylanimonas protaetiae]